MGLLDTSPTEVLQTAYRLAKRLMSGEQAGVSVFVSIVGADGALNPLASRA